MKFLYFLIFFLCLSSVMALNETNETYGDIYSGELIEETICEEQIKILLDEYNNLTKDYHEGASCGTVVYLLKDNNMFCGENLKNCREDVGTYRFGFWFFLILLLLIAVIFIYKGASKS